MMHAFTCRRRDRMAMGTQEKVVRTGHVLEMLSVAGLATMLCMVPARLLLVWLRNAIGALMVTHPSVLQPDPIL